MSDWHAESRCVHAGGSDAAGEPVVAALHLATTYRQGGPYEYVREGSPAFEHLEHAVGGLEGGHAVAFSSGMAACAAIIDALPAGARVLAPTVCYLGVRNLLSQRAEQGHLRVDSVDQTDAEATIAALEGADLLWLETPSNPLLGIADVRALAQAAHARGATVVVDSTLATPLLQRPLELGADLVVHSATKYLAGHSDALLGLAVGADEQARDRLAHARHVSGAVPGPFEAFLAVRGLRTLALRMERAQANAAELARRLAEHRAVQLVRYPGLPDHPSHELAASQMDGFGAMVAFELISARVADAACAAVTLIANATSLGGVETLMERRGRYPEEQAHVPDSLIRLSVGCEHVEDIWADLERALA
jgi:cystathionine gamma-synthase